MNASDKAPIYRHTQRQHSDELLSNVPMSVSPGREDCCYAELIAFLPHEYAFVAWEKHVQWRYS